MILHFLLREKVYCPFFTRADLLIREMAEYCTESKVELDIIGPGKIIKLNLERELVLLKKALILLVLSFFTLGTMVGIGAADQKAGIPRIGGTWNLVGTAFMGNKFVEDKGTCSFITHIDLDGYEVISKVFYEGEFWSASERLYDKSAFSFDLKPEVRLDSKIVTFQAPNGNDFTLKIESDVKGTAEGKMTFTEGAAVVEVEVEYTFTRDSSPVPVIPPSDLPRIAGTWHSEGKGTLGNEQVSDSGTVVIKAITGTDGYEIITGYAAKGQIKEASGEVRATYDYSLAPADFGGELKISTRTFPFVFNDNRFDITVESETRLIAKRVGEVESDSVKPLAETFDVLTEFMEAEYVLTREAPQPASGSSGCNAAGAVPLAVLLLPLLLLFRKP